MAIKAAVVYDAPRHKTIVLRTQSVSTTEKYEVLDTISSFSQHCDSLRGIASSVTDVSALWGGPPFVHYTVVNNRFRVLIIWDEGPADFSQTSDVHRALKRLEKAVTVSADGLANRNVDSVSHVYDEANFALTGDYPVNLEDAIQPQKPRSKLLSIPLASARRSSNAEIKRKKSASGRLFGKIGNALKGVKGEDAHHLHKNTPPSMSMRDPSETADSSGAAFGSEAHFDDREGDLAFADDVFAWADFGKPLSNETESLQWFEALLKGEHAHTKRPRAPSLRPGRSLDSPLKLGVSSPSRAQLTDHGEGLTGAEAISDRQAAAPGVTKTPSQLTGSITTPHGSAIESSAESATPAIMETPTPAQTPQLSSTASYYHSGAGQSNTGLGMNQSSSLKPSPGSLPHSSLSVPQSLGPASQSSPMPPPESPSDRSEKAIAVNASPLIANSLPPRHEAESSMGQAGLPSMQQSVISAYTPQSSVSSSAYARVPAPSPASSGPAQQSEDFDVSALGGYKDKSAFGPPERTDEDEIIREKMNEFAMTMMSGNFRLALQQVIATLRFLSQINPRRDSEIVTCSNYYLAQKLLLRKSALEAELTSIPGGTPKAVERHVECALLSMFLAELKHLTPRHRVAAMKMAVEKNSIVGNYGMCARWLRRLVEKAPVGKKADFANRLQICVRNGERNSHMPLTNKMCYNSLQLVFSPYGSCSVCEAVFHGTVGGVVEGQACGVCFVGVVERKM